MVKIVNKKGEPLFKTITPRTRLKFSVAVIIVNFVLGIIGMILGADLTALGVFLAMSNTPLYVYVLGESLKPTQIPDSYYQQQHGGAGGLGTIIGNQQGGYGGEYGGGGYGGTVGGYDTHSSGHSNDDYNIPVNMTATTEVPKPVKTVKKDASEIG